MAECKSVNVYVDEAMCANITGKQGKADISTLHKIRYFYLAMTCFLCLLKLFSLFFGVIF